MDAAFAWADEPGETAAVDYDVRPDGSFAVWPENWETVCLFWSIRRCWRLRPMGGVMGLDWCQVQARMQLKGLDAARMTREEARLELMESGVLEALD